MNERSKRDLIEERALTLLRQAFETDSTRDDPLQHAIKLEQLIRDRYSENEYIEMVVRLALHLSRVTYIGFYSITINKLLREKVDSLPETLFPELFRNPYLSEEEKVDLLKEYELEQKILGDAFHRSLKSPLPEIQFFSSFSDLEEYAVLEDLYSLSCHRQSYKVRQPPYQIQSLLEGGQIKEVPVMELLISVLYGDHPYTRSTIHRIKSKFWTELKLIKASR